MSVVRSDNTKIILPRTGPDLFWELVREHFAGESQLRWKYLAMLALRENAGWPLDVIGSVFGHPKGHITRCLRHIKRDMKACFEMSPEYLELTDEDTIHEMLLDDSEDGLDEEDWRC